MLSILFAGAYGYTLETEFSGSNFFDNFHYETFASPTHGFVDYSGPEAGLTEVLSNGRAQIRVETTQTVDSGYRKSTRLRSKKEFTEGLFIMDATHLPQGCAVWPSWWLVGADWPYGGEIDIIEYANTDDQNAAALHVGDNRQGRDVGQCIVEEFPPVTGDLREHNCGFQPGCQYKSGNHNTAGYAFNIVGGGVVAMELVQGDSGWIKVWEWNRDSIPADITADKPDPTTWGTPMAHFTFGTHCTSDHFGSMSMIINTELCGDWAGADYWYNTVHQCGASTGQTCPNHVKYNGAAFSDAYWEINYVKVFGGRDPSTSCVAEGDDPFASGTELQCCGGLKKCLSSPDWTYTCKSCTDSYPDDSEWASRTCVPSAKTESHCVPKSWVEDADIIGDMSWIGTVSDPSIATSDIPSECSDTVKKQGYWMYSKFYSLRHDQDSCGFNDHAKETYKTLEHPECVYKACVPKGGVSDDALNGAIDYIRTVSNPSVDLSTFPAGCDTAAARATYAFSKFYALRKATDSCDFSGSAELTGQIAYPKCVYQATLNSENPGRGDGHGSGGEDEPVDEPCDCDCKPKKPHGRKPKRGKKPEEDCACCKPTKPGKPGKGKPGKACCKAFNLKCLKCSTEQSEEFLCEENPGLAGCDDTKPSKPSKPGKSGKPAKH